MEPERGATVRPFAHLHHFALATPTAIGDDDGAQFVSTPLVRHLSASLGL